MGEVEDRLDTIQRPSNNANFLTRWFFPNQLEQMQALEERLFSDAQQLTLKLAEAETRAQRIQDQNRQLLNEDIGQYKDRWRHLAIGDYNPDTITYSEYQKMLSYDSQVLAGWDLVQMGVLMKPWRIRHEDSEIVKELTRAFNNLRYPSFRDGMKQMMQAIAFGCSVTEVVYEQYGDYWFPRHENGLKTLNPDTIRFHSDAYGNLKAILQRSFISSGFRSISPFSMGTGIELPLDRVLVWSHGKLYGNWYGTPLLQGCYKNWFIKDAMLKFANIAYERFGSPILMGVAQNIKDMGTISEAIQHLYARSQGVIVKRSDKDPTDVKVLESRRREMPFDNYIRYHDEMILRRMLIGQKLFEGGGGTYGPKVPLDIIFMRFEDFRMELVDVINDLLRMITDLNFDVKDYPKLEFAPLTTGDQQQLRQLIYDAIDRGVIDRGEPWVRRELSFPDFEKPVRRIPIPGTRDEENEDSVSDNETDFDAQVEAYYREWRKEVEAKRKRRDEEDEEEDTG